MKKKTFNNSKSQLKRLITKLTMGALLISIVAMLIAYFVCLEGAFTHWPLESNFNSVNGDVALIITSIALPILLMSILSLVRNQQDNNLYS